MTDGEPATEGPPAAIAHAPRVPEGDRVRLRRRTVKVLVAGVALGSTGHIAAVTVAPIVATAARRHVRPERGRPAPRSSSARRSARSPCRRSWPAAVVGPGSAARLRDRRRWARLVAIGATVAGARCRLLMFGTFIDRVRQQLEPAVALRAADMYPSTGARRRSGSSSGRRRSERSLGPNLVGPSGDVATALGLPPLTGRLSRPVRSSSPP